MLDPARSDRDDALEDETSSRDGASLEYELLGEDRRIADLFVLVEKGKTEEVGREIWRRFPSVFEVSLRLNSVANVVARLAFSGPAELHDTMEAVWSIPFVSKVDFSEVLRIARRRVPITTDERPASGGTASA